MKIGRLPGFRDFYPEDLALRNHIFSVWRDVATRYGFEEYDGPPLEPLELYTRKSGPEIVDQLYRFEDRGGRAVALRPEMTPTFARMIAARAGALPKPIRWFSVPQLFRYERPQRGRLREHFQLNLDIVGEEGTLADAEVISAALEICRELGLGSADVVARISDRRLVGGILRSLGVAEGGLGEAFAALDRAERESEERVLERLEALGLGRRAATEVRSLGSQRLEDLARRYAGAEGVEEAASRLEAILMHLQDFGCSDSASFDAGLVRGLAYYTGTVFEVWDRRGELRAICGGGRYDDLLASLGDVDLPAVGFGMGDVVLSELLRERGLVPEPRPTVEDFVICVAEEQRSLALRVVRALREQRRRAVFEYRARPVGKQFRAADRAGAERAIVIGPEEVARGAVRIRQMATGKEREVSMDAFLAPGRGAGEAFREAEREETTRG